MGIGNHGAIPAIRRHIDARLRILTLPRDAIPRSGIADTITVAGIGAVIERIAVAVPHFITCTARIDRGAADAAFILVAIVDRDNAFPLPFNTVLRFRILDVIQRFDSLPLLHPTGTALVPHAP